MELSAALKVWHIINISSFGFGHIERRDGRMEAILLLIWIFRIVTCYRRGKKSGRHIMGGVGSGVRGWRVGWGCLMGMMSDWLCGGDRSEFPLGGSDMALRLSR